MRLILMNNDMKSDLVKDDEFEISIFGPGYGEAIALHLGFGKWILVDSCLEPKSGKPAQLQYLESLGIDTSSAVKLIVATHWHDDHVQGMGALVRECKSAMVAVSAALKSQHFLQLISLYGEGVFPGSSGVTEFVNVFRIIDERRTIRTKIDVPKLAGSDKLLYKDTIQLNARDHEVEIHSLSPSDSAIMSAQLDFRQRIPNAGTHKKRVICPGTNNTSVVLWVRIGNHRILLGSDLQKTTDPKMGWTVIVNESQTIRERASVYKVAHHGAESSHDSDIWSKLLSDKPFALLSPYMVGDNYLPREEDLKRLTALTPHGYITALPNRRTYKASDRVVRDMVEDATKSIQSVNIGWGQIRLRRNIGNNADFQVELFGDAYKIVAS